MSEIMRENDLDNEVHIDTFLDFSKQFTINDGTEEWFVKTELEREIDKLINSWLYFWFRLYKNWDKIQLTPIFNTIDDEALLKISYMQFKTGVDVLKTGEDLFINNSNYFKFNNINFVTISIEDTEGKINNIL